MAKQRLLDLAMSLDLKLTDQEIDTVTAASNGSDLVFPELTDLRPIVLRWLCTDPAAKGLVDPRGLRIENARISDTLDLRNISIEFLLRFHRCKVEGDINLADARTRSIGFNGTSCRALIADRCIVSGGAFLASAQGDRFRAEAVFFRDATINGNLIAEGALIGPSSGAPVAASLDRVDIRGGLIFEDARIIGPVTLYGSVIGNLASFRGGRLEAASRPGPDPGSLPGSVDVADPAPRPDRKLGAADIDALPILLNVQQAKIGSHLLLDRLTVVNGRALVWDVDIAQDLNCWSCFYNGTLRLLTRPRRSYAMLSGDSK
jgi:hypothetical protein